MSLCCKQLIWAFVILIGSINFGEVVSFPSASSHQIMPLHGLTKTDLKWSFYNAVASLIGIFGPFCTQMILKIVKQSRKKTIFIIAVYASCIWLVNMIVKFSIWAGIVARAMIGLAGGAFSSICPMYVVEIAPPEARGFFGCLPEAGIILGEVLVNFLGTPLGYLGLCGFNSCLALVLAILICFIPESPALLVLERKQQQKALTENDDSDETKVKVSLWQLKYIKCLLTGCGTAIFQQFSGIGPITANLSTIMSESGLHIDSNYQAGIASLGQFLATFMGGGIIDKIGRKRTWILSNIGIITFLIILALNIKYNWSTYIPLVVILIYMVFYAWGVGPIPWFIMPEYFPAEVRAQGTNVASSVSWATQFVWVFVWPIIVKSMGEFGGFLFFACCSVVSVFFGFFCIYEPPPLEVVTDSEKAHLREIEENSTNSCNNERKDGHVKAKLAKKNRIENRTNIDDNLDEEIEENYNSNGEIIIDNPTEL
ncbi:major facilitator superfamily transporter [Tritrichomonas foetus]|uniref:Major facilitator superfamily transporter n=1 Tax=Tritrichomonas foetus TaxID=1144522 RepID=A0A1J4KM68_9EUKA|nr:major facilitator superfamily transporter [Tritrichomonas foetus]|eukprot:OHT12315.1 major facilitator superfamily transporter [Tritrichomonas foetus]